MIQLCPMFRFLIPSASRQITPTARDRVDMRPRAPLCLSLALSTREDGGNPITPFVPPVGGEGGEYEMKSLNSLWIENKE